MWQPCPKIATLLEPLPAGDSIERLFSVGIDHAVRGGDGHAGQHKTGCNLVFIEEALIRSRIEERMVVVALDCAMQPFVGVDQLDLVDRHSNGWCRA